MIEYCKVFSSWRTCILVVLLIAALLGCTILDKVQQGQRDGKIYSSDDTPIIGPHHWDPSYVPTVKGYPEPLIVNPISIFCQPMRNVLAWCNWCIW